MFFGIGVFFVYGYSLVGLCVCVLCCSVLCGFGLFGVVL